MRLLRSLAIVAVLTTASAQGSNAETPEGTGGARNAWGYDAVPGLAGAAGPARRRAGSAGCFKGRTGGYILSRVDGVRPGQGRTGVGVCIGGSYRHGSHGCSRAGATALRALP